MKSNYFSEKKNLCNFSCFETYNWNSKQHFFIKNN